MGKRRKKKFDNEEGCGLPWLFHTTPDDPFFRCCVKHDKLYDIVPPSQSTFGIDQDFRECCLKKAGDDRPLRVRAKLYYFLARRYGQLRYAFGRFGLWNFGTRR